MLSSSVGEAKTLPFTTELLTRNVELIKTINRLEHEVSYSKLSVVNTAFARQKSAEAESRITLPAKTQSHQQVIMTVLFCTVWYLFMTVLTAWKKFLVDLILAIK